MWNWVLNLITTAVTSAFAWFQSILNAAPGAWNAIFTLFVILVICRFLLAPVLGVTFGGRGSDKAVKKEDSSNG